MSHFKLLFAQLYILRYRFKHWLFQWKIDQEGDIAFVIANRLAFVKYKEHTCVNFEGHKMDAAPKYVSVDYE